MASAYRKRQRRSRDAYAIATNPYLSLYRPLALSLVRLPPPVSSPYSDLRRYNPTARVSAPFSFRRYASRLVDRPKAGRPLSAKLSRPVVAFAAPEHVMICHRRKTRREVLLAKGRGGAGNRRPRRNEWSDVSC